MDTASCFLALVLVLVLIFFHTFYVPSRPSFSCSSAFLFSCNVSVTLVLFPFNKTPLVEVPSDLSCSLKKHRFPSFPADWKFIFWPTPTLFSRFFLWNCPRGKLANKINCCCLLRTGTEQQQQQRCGQCRVQLNSKAFSFVCDNYYPITE